MAGGAEFIYLRGGPLHGSVVLAEPADGELELPAEWPHHYVKVMRVHDVEGRPLPVFQHANDCCNEYDDVSFIDDE